MVKQIADGLMMFRGHHGAGRAGDLFRPPPDLFREGQGVVAKGGSADGVFVAREVLAKHDENYMPPEVAEALTRAGAWRQRRRIAGRAASPTP